MRSTTVFISLTLLSLLMSGTAHAAKEKFVRTKPHVNVGTINAGENERAVFSLSTVDFSDEKEGDVLCSFLGTVIVSIPVGARLVDPADWAASLSEFQEWKTFDVMVQERQLLQIPLELPLPPTGPQPMRQTWLVEVRSDDDRSRPVGVSCGLELGFHVFDPITGETKAHYRPQFYFRTADV